MSATTTAPGMVTRVQTAILNRVDTPAAIIQPPFPLRPGTPVTFTASLAHVDGSWRRLRQSGRGKLADNPAGTIAGVDYARVLSEDGITSYWRVPLDSIARLDVDEVFTDWTHDWVFGGCNILCDD